MRYLIDTDWAVWGLRGRKDIRDRMLALYQQGLAISAVTLAELTTGVHRSSDPRMAAEGLQGFLTRVSVLPFTEDIARHFGTENARLLSTASPSASLILRSPSPPPTMGLFS